MVTKKEKNTNINNQLFKLIDNATGRTLPPNIVKLELILELDSPPIIKIEAYLDKLSNNDSVDFIKQQFKIEEI